MPDYAVKVHSSLPPSQGNVNVVGRKEDILEHLNTIIGAYAASYEKGLPGIIQRMVEDISAKNKHASAKILTPEGIAMTFSCIPSTAHRHNSSYRAYEVRQALKSNAFKTSNSTLILVVRNTDEAYAGCVSAAGAYHSYDMHGSKQGVKASLDVGFVGADLNEADVKRCQLGFECTNSAAALVDAPCNYVNTVFMVKKAIEVADEVGIPEAQRVVIQGEELKEKGFGGLYGVGKAAEFPPALVVLSYLPENAEKTVAWVGKGIVYDTGGLSIKSKTGMPGMKDDMGGSAAVLMAFRHAVLNGAKTAIHAILCLAENSVAANATRPDDIHTLYSGKTVEINNTDAEGRLVMADGVAYAAKHLNPDVIIDIATLTGAQAVALGKNWGAIMTDDDDLEARAVEVGKKCGNMVFPIPFAPELLFSEFESKVADFKNSVQSRNNCQCSCAGLFMHANLPEDYKGAFCHFDIAAPAFIDERGTGFGVALLSSLFE
eukprot:CAMPEP_0113901922 /NCGR_PEP_ID=MMETSP0780_2-20120614/21535_1 /TAXON_ID=652834 /ORGANISM="Palpitomonas bilix" /LENGTH=488 /DNA_ID=CAMNT_0000894613 /DNA_START=35 /DNA_END=1501 /DNA_ORIENTATION=- /assembly_acc=CAM_ASM_000599